MRKLIAVLIIALMMMQIAIAAEVYEPGKEAPKATPKTEGDKAIVLTKDTRVYTEDDKGITSGKDMKEGSIVIFSQKEYDLWTEMTAGDPEKTYADISPSLAKTFIENKATYDDKTNTFTYSKTVPDDRMLDEHRTKTTTTTTFNADGTTTKTTTQRTEVCGGGLTKCKDKADEKNWEAAAKQTSVTIITGKDASGKEYVSGKIYGESAPAMSEEKIGILSGYIAMSKTEADKLGLKADEDGIYRNPDGTIYYKKQSESADFVGITENIIGGYTADKDGTVIVEYDNSGNPTFYTDRKYKYNEKGQLEKDANGKPILEKEGTKVNSFSDACKARKCTPAEERYYEKVIRQQELRSLRQTDFYIWTKAFFKAYTQYKGIAMLTSAIWPSYGEWVAENRQKIADRFCAASGITNCAVQRICTKLVKIEPDNTVVGITLGGKVVPSASLNAESTPPVEVAGMTKEQLINLLGNVSTIGGRRIALNDPAFNPEALGNIELRFYHVQYGLDNNDKKEDMRYNIVFKDVKEGNSSYGDSVREARWWADDKTIEPGERGYDDLYKWSATQYNTVCLTFDPKMISGVANPIVGPRFEDDLCVPIIEYSGGATSITIPEEARGNMTAAPGASEEEQQAGASV